MRKTLLSVGVSDLNPDGWSLPPWAIDKILTAIDKSVEEGTAFLEEIELAILRALRHQEWKMSRADVKISLKRAVEAATKFVDALDQIPLAGQNLYRLEGISYYVAQQQARTLQTTATRAYDRAIADLSGRGDDADPNPAILAADIARALQQIGIAPSVSRPKLNRRGEISASALWKVAEVCFKLAGFSHKDLRGHLKNGLKIQFEGG